MFFPLIYFKYAGCDSFNLYACIKITIYTQYYCIWKADWSHTGTQKTKKSTVNRVASSFRSVKSSKSNSSSSFLVNYTSESDTSMGIGKRQPICQYMCYTLCHFLNLSNKLPTSIYHTIQNMLNNEITYLVKAILVIASFLFLIIPNS